MSELATKEDLTQLGRAFEEYAATMVSSVDAQTKAMSELAAAMTEQRHIESARASGGRAEIRVEAGGVAVWVAATCSIVAVVSCGFLALALLWVAIKMNDMGHQQNAVYQSVPGLRELVAEQMKQNEQTSKPAPQEDQQ